MLQPPGASAVAVAADVAAAARTIHRFRFFSPPSPGFASLCLPVYPATSVSGCVAVAAAAAAAARRNTQAPRTARHHRRHSGRGRRRHSRIAGRRRDAMRETPTTVLRMCARTLVKGALTTTYYYFSKLKKKYLNYEYGGEE